MYLKLLKNDFRKNPGKHLILLLFLSLSVTLAVSVFFNACTTVFFHFYYV